MEQIIHHPKTINRANKAALKTTLAIAFVLSSLYLVSQAFAISGPNKAWSWDSGISGIHWNGRAEVQASYRDPTNGNRHSRRAYIRFTRQSGPSLDTGRLYTPTASSRTDSRIHSVQKQVWDSVLIGDAYKTKFNYGFEWFSL